MKRTDVYEEVRYEEYDNLPTVNDVQWVLHSSLIHLPGDYIEVDEGSIRIWRYREETDEEYQQRLAVEKQNEESRKMAAVMITQGEYDELKEKADKYDQLNKQVTNKAIV